MVNFASQVNGQFYVASELSHEKLTIDSQKFT
jgi:hypothetical protein